MKISSLNKFQSLPYFTKEMAKQLEPVKPTLDFNLNYWQKTKSVLRLKRGFYILKARWERESDKDGLREFLANKLVEPSYLSFEYVLQKNGLLTEGTTTVTCATIRTPRQFNGPIGNFIYFSLSPKLFTGYVLKPFSQNTIMVATPAKALFDFIYLRSRLIKEINKNWLEELRINWENLSKEDIFEFQKYIDTIGTKKMAKITYD